MNQTGKTLAFVGVILQLALLIGIGVTLVGMTWAFADIGVGAGKPVDQNAVAARISIALCATGIGVIFALIGAVFILLALFAAKYRAPSFYRDLWAISVLWLIAVPLGTVLGILMMIYLSTHRREFMVGPNT
jgi:hypothetical protein